MKKHVNPSSLFAAAAFAAVFAGCVSPQNINPIVDAQKGPADAEIYEAGKQKTERKEEKKYTVDVFVDCEAVDMQRVSIDNEKAKTHLVTSIDGYLRSKLQKFPFFKVTTADSVTAKIRAKRLAAAVEAGDEPAIKPSQDEAQYVVLAKIDSVMVHGDGGVANSSTVAGTGTGVAGVGSIAGAQGSLTGIGAGTTLLAAGAAAAALGNALEPNVVDISMTFEFFDNVREETILTESVVRKYSGSSSDNTPALVLHAARECVDQFISIVGNEYLQEARVLETRGDGKFAYVSLGKKDGVSLGSRIQFSEFADFDDVMDSWAHELRAIGYGTVVGNVEPTKCWVKVDDFDKAGIRKYHFVKVIETPKETSSVLERVGISL